MYYKSSNYKKIVVFPETMWAFCLKLAYTLLRKLIEILLLQFDDEIASSNFTVYFYIKL